MSYKMDLYRETEEYIESHRPVDFKDLLTRIPFDKAADSYIDEYFIYAMKLCTLYDAAQCCNVLYQYWEKLFKIDELDIPYFVQLMSELNDIDMFIYMYKYPAKHFTYEEVMDVCIDNIDDSRVERIIGKCEQIFGQQSIHFYREIYRRSIEENYNKTVSTQMARFLRTHEGYATYPTWTFPQQNVPSIEDVLFPRDYEVEIEVNDLSKVADMVLTMNEKKNREEVMTGLKKMSKEELNRYVQGHFKVLQSLDQAKNQELFHIYGPSHPLPEPIHEIETRFGGSRMMLSLESDLGHLPFTDVQNMYKDIELVQKYWFTGTCDWCFQKIRRWRHALRMPGVSGGWSGCYCSSACITESIIESNLNAYYLLQLWSKIYADILEYGIQDMIETPETEIVLPKRPTNVSYFNSENITVETNETLMINKYDDLSGLLEDYEDTPVIVLYGDEDTDQKVFQAYDKEKASFLEKNNNFLIFVLVFLDDESDIEGIAAPEMVSYYQNDIIASETQFQESETSIGNLISLVDRKVYGDQAMT